MRRVIQLLLLSLGALLTSSTVDGAVLRAVDEGDERQAKLNNVNLERELQRRRMDSGKGKGKGGKGKGKGNEGGSNASKGSKGVGPPIRFLPDGIEPIPFVNCIPLPPRVGGDGTSKSKNGRGGTKGKGKGHRRNNRSGMTRERDLHENEGMIRTGRNRGGNRSGARKLGGNHHHLNHAHNQMDVPKMMMARLPFCPEAAPTIFPTALPSLTPTPTSTPLPSITPFPSFTPFPTGEGTADGPTSRPGGPTAPVAPGSPNAPVAPGGTAAPVAPGGTTAPVAPGGTTAPVAPGAPTVAPGTGGAPVATPPGTTRILVESTLEYGFFDTFTAREPTQAELDGIMVETTRFYTDILKAAYPNLSSFDATFVSSAFRAGNAKPILIEFDANAFFTTGTTIPTAAEVFKVLEGANYQNYIQDYAWVAAPGEGGLFFETQQVAYNARVTTGLPAR